MTSTALPCASRRDRQRRVFLSTLPNGRTSRRHREQKIASMKKSIYSMPGTAGFLPGRQPALPGVYIRVKDPTSGIKNVEKISEPVQHNERRSYRGFNLFCGDDLDLFRAIAARRERASVVSEIPLCESCSKQLYWSQEYPGCSSCLHFARPDQEGRSHLQSTILTALGRHGSRASTRKLREQVVIPSLATPLPA